MSGFTAFLREHWPVMLVLAVPVAIVVAMLIVLSISDSNAQRECINSGGNWTKTGESTIYQVVGNMALPITINQYGCAGK
jgi:hypothetical protein